MENPTYLADFDRKHDENEFSNNGMLELSMDPVKEDNESKFKNMLNSKRNKKIIKYSWLVVLNLAVFGYFFTALNFWYHYTNRGWELCDGFGMLLILYCVVYFVLLYYACKRFFGKTIVRVALKPIYGAYCKICDNRKTYYIFHSAIIGVLLLTLVVFLYFDTYGSRERLISLIGLVFFLVFGYVFSKDRSKIIWRPVIWGVALQFGLGLFTIRWEVGRLIFKCAGDKVEKFLGYSDSGSSFVFGSMLVDDLGVFAFKVLPVIFFFSLIIEVCFYWGAMQWVCLKMGWFLQVTMGTTVCESVICAANTFLGMSESPLLIRPYIPDLTKSELHAIMSSGFATVSGTVLAAYINFGVNPAHLITASVMSAPAALCYAKLFYPELEKSKTAVSNIVIMKSEESSVLDAASKGASGGIVLVLNIAANLIAFVSLIAFVNGILGWLGMLVGIDLSLQWILGKVFTPLSWIMGVPWSECEIVGELIGIKTIINEFVAYEKLGNYTADGRLSSRGEAIATYALCGFTNPSSIGIMVGALSAMAPSRRSDIAGVAMRGMVAGCAVCFMTACIAGILLPPGAFSTPGNTTFEILNLPSY